MPRWALHALWMTAALVALALCCALVLSRLVVAVFNGRSGNAVEFLLPRL
jgi:hypothetical protein